MTVHSKILFARIAVGVCFLLAWELAAGRLVDRSFTSTPGAVLREIWDYLFLEDGISDLRITFIEGGLGYLIGMGVGMASASVLSAFPSVVRVLDPYIIAIYGIPRIALAPLFVIWFGIGLESKVVLVISIVFFIGFINTLAGLEEVDDGLIRVFRASGATPRQVFLKVRIPAAAPFIFVGLRLAVPYAFIGAIIGEFIAASGGLGYAIQVASTGLNTTAVLAISVLLGGIVVVMNSVLRFVEGKIFSWQPGRSAVGANI